MAFRNKYKDISEFDGDINVICECEDPAKSKSKEYKEFASNYYWIGDNKNKGLGIFAKDNIKLEHISDNKQDFKYFIPLRVNDTFNLLGIWAMPEYVEMIHDYYNANRELFNENLVMCGDLNSNVVLDEHHKNKSFSMLIHYLKKDGLVGAYHNLNREKHGKETQATFFLTKKLNSRLHLDHVFSAPYITKDLQIIDNIKWIKMSDHLPVVFEIDESKFA